MNCTVHGDAKSWTQLSDFHILSSKYLEGHCLLILLKLLQKSIPLLLYTFYSLYFSWL